MNDKYTLITRRDFVRGAVGATLGGTVMGVGARELRAPAGRTVRASRVTLVRDPGVLNAGHDVDVATLGIEGIDAMDAGVTHEHVIGYGALGVGGRKMKIHRAAIARLFESNDQVLDAEQIYALAQTL